jgi:hypothetical protein
MKEEMSVKQYCVDGQSPARTDVKRNTRRHPCHPERAFGAKDLCNLPAAEKNLRSTQVLRPAKDAVLTMTTRQIS